MPTQITRTSQMNIPPEQTSRQLNTFCCDNIIITSPNSGLPPIVDPTAMSKIFSDPPYPRECRELRFFSNAYPWLAFTPQTPRYQGSLLGRLACSKHSLVEKNWIEWRRHTYFLKDDVYEGWHNLEVALATVTQELLCFSKVTLPLEWEWFPLPSKHSHQCGHLGLEKFKKSILLARDAFVPLMAICSFSIAMTPDFRKENPPWARRLVDLGVHPSFVQELQVSQIADFSAHRMGAFVKSDCGMLPYIDRYISANVPLWFLWHTNKSFVHHKMRIYCPTEEDVAVAKQNLCYSTNSLVPAPSLVESRFITNSLVPAPSLVESRFIDVPSPTIDKHAPPQRPFPPLPQHSRQRLGETLHDFIARSAQKCEEMDQARRQNRERAQASHQIPGKGGPVVFVWENVDGHPIRQKVDRKQVESEWEEYTDGQRKYNAFFNEWDLAKEFAPEEDSAPDFDEDESIYYAYMSIDKPSEMLPTPATSLDVPCPSSPTLPPVPPAPELTPESLPPPDYSSVLAQVYDPPTPIAPLKGLQTLELVVYNRYGFTWCDLPIPYDHKAILGHSRPSPQWHTTRMIVCDTASNWAPMVQHLEDPISDFVQCFLDKPAQVPPILWDLSTANGQYVLSKGHKALTLMTYGEDTVYKIDFGSNSDPINGVLEPPYEIIVSDPLTALEWVRRRALVSRRDFARHCVATGKPFMALSQSWQLQGPQDTDSAWYPPPGYRKAGWKPDIIDFRHYEACRKDFLLHAPRARAAASNGGILWRLTVESIDWDYVIAGPSPEVQQSTVPKLFRGDPNNYWDDELQENDIDILCGVYKIYSEGRHETQVSHSSWWPKPNIWKGSGLDVGYWSPTCEVWYQKRLQAIHDGTATLRTSTQWRKSMQFCKNTPRFMTAIREQCAKTIVGPPRSECMGPYGRSTVGV